MHIEPKTGLGILWSWDYNREPPHVGDGDLEELQISFLLSHRSSSPFLVFQFRAFLALILRLGVIWFFSFCCCCSELGLLYYNYIQSVSFRTQSSSLFSDYASNFVYFGKTVVQPSVVLCYNEMLYVHTQTSQSPL